MLTEPLHPLFGQIVSKDLERLRVDRAVTDQPKVVQHPADRFHRLLAKILVENLHRPVRLL